MAPAIQGVVAVLPVEAIVAVEPIVPGTPDERVSAIAALRSSIRSRRPLAA